MFSQVPLDIVKSFIIPNLDAKSFMAFVSTCKRYNGLFAPLDRLKMMHEKRRIYPKESDGKLVCFSCKAAVFVERYEVHINRHASRMDLKKCIRCHSIGMMPQKDIRMEHPYIGCDNCGKGISNQSDGCIHCGIFSCRTTKCEFCRELYLSCDKHICSYDPVKRWTYMLKRTSVCFRISYMGGFVTSANRICAITSFPTGLSLFVYWIIFDRETLDDRIPAVENGYDIYFIVDKDALDLSDKNLIAAHYGKIGKTNKWIKYA